MYIFLYLYHSFNHHARDQRLWVRISLTGYGLRCISLIDNISERLPTNMMDFEILYYHASTEDASDLGLRYNKKIKLDRAEG